MMENQAKEELIEMKAKLEQGGKTCRKSSQVRLGIGNSRLGVEIARPAINIKAPKDSSRVRLGIGSYA